MAEFPDLMNAIAEMSAEANGGASREFRDIMDLNVMARKRV